MRTLPKSPELPVQPLHQTPDLGGEGFLLLPLAKSHFVTFLFLLLH